MTGPGAVEVAARPATLADVDETARLATEARPPLADVRGGPVLLATDHRSGDERAHLESAVTAEEALLLVGTLDEVVVGYLLAERRQTAVGSLLAEIEELYVDPEARQVGVGAAMLDAAIVWAEDHGCLGIDATALPGDRATKNFFEGHGLVARAITAHRPFGEDRAGS